MVYHDVRSLLRQRALVSLTADQTVREAAVTLSSQEIGAAPVLAAGKLVGIFSERDLLNRVVAVGRDPDLTLVRQVMTPDPRTVTAHGSLCRAFGIMVEGKFRHLPVVEGDGRVVAMLSMRDIPPEYRIMHQRWMDQTQARTPRHEAPVMTSPLPQWARADGLTLNPASA